ncbi:MAG: HD domain-containing protein [Thermomicrobiales bacterium]
MLEPLPPEVRELLDTLNAPPRLIAHLRLVHHVAFEVTTMLDRTWPGLPYDRQAVLVGAATHDIGKIVHRHELSEPGRQHEDRGVTLLRQHGFSEEQARFARTHGQWESDPATMLEDLLVALADTIWKGQRDENLERVLALHVAALQCQEPWAIYLALDDLIQPITQGADARLLWHTQHPL